MSNPQVTLHGPRLTLRAGTETDVEVLATIRAHPDVHRRWGGGDDLVAEVAEDLAETDVETFVLEYEGRVVGAVQWGEESDPDYRHANIDIYLDPDVHGRGLGTEAVRVLARHLVADVGHRRLVIDPAADNLAAIHCYGKVGFRPVGIMRGYERGPDGTYHDNLLMDLLVEDLVDE